MKREKAHVNPIAFNPGFQAQNQEQQGDKKEDCRGNPKGFMAHGTDPRQRLRSKLSEENVEKISIQTDEYNPDPDLPEPLLFVKQYIGVHAGGFSVLLQLPISGCVQFQTYAFFLILLKLYLILLIIYLIMLKDARKLPDLCPSCSAPLQVTSLGCDYCETTVTGKFQLPMLARLSVEEQKFIVDFVKSSGSLKVMAQQLGLSYPTVRNLLDSIIVKLESNQKIKI
jgi:hypothetical protein